MRGLRHRLSPTVCIELGEYRSDMKLGGVERNTQPACDRMPFVKGQVETLPVERCARRKRCVHCSKNSRIHDEHHLHLPTYDVGKRGLSATIGDMY